MIVGIPKESYPNEKRVAMIPTLLSQLKKKDLQVLVETKAGEAATFPDNHYVDAGAKIVDRKDLFERAEIILQVRTPGANPQAADEEIELLHEGQILIGLGEPLDKQETPARLAEKGVTHFALELMPRITRAQTMDVLSSMATVAGYKAVLKAADALPRMFPLLMTAAGTVKPAHVFIVGAGVMGLQAIATAKRLGAVVEAYDIRPAAKEQVLSLGAKFAELKLQAKEAETAGGYAREMDQEFYDKQREAMKQWVADSDVVITTAGVPGKKSPVLVTEEMVHAMRRGSVVVDMAAERGGNVEVSKPGETFVTDHGVVVMAPVNVPSDVPFHASQMYARNITSFLTHLVGEDNKIKVDVEDEITRETLVTYLGEIAHPRVREVLELPPLERPVGKAEPTQADAVKEDEPKEAESDAERDAVKAPEKPEGQDVSTNDGTNEPQNTSTAQAEATAEDEPNDSCESDAKKEQPAAESTDDASAEGDSDSDDKAKD